MFSSDAKLFLSANNNVNCAKSLLNECIRLVNEAVIADSSGYQNLKTNLEESGINSLVNTIENTKRSLFELDQSFASEYMTLIQEFLQTDTIDTSNMSDEEKEQYSIEMNSYYRDYNYNLLYILEKYEDSGQLTDELANQLKIQRTIVEQYTLKDEMDILAQTSDEYIEKYKNYAEFDRELINLNVNLTNEEKNKMLEEYNKSFNANLDVLQLNCDVKKKTDELSKLTAGSTEYIEKEKEIYQLQINYYQGKETLTQAEREQLDKLRGYAKLNDLYLEKAELGNNWIPFDEGDLDEDIYQLKIDMGIASKDEIEYMNMDGWDKLWHNTSTFVASVFNGVFAVEEQIFDGAVMAVGEVGSWFGADTKWAEDVVKTDVAGDQYRGFVLTTGVNEVVAYGPAHTTGSFTGEMLGTIALQFLPGGTAVMVGAHTLKGMGSGGEKALNQGKDYQTAFAYSALTGAIEGGSSYILYGKGATFNQKMALAAGKEYAKEGTSILIDGEFDFMGATDAAIKAMVITAVNEKIVAKYTEKVAQKFVSKEQNKLAKEYKSSKKEADKMNKEAEHWSKVERKQGKNEATDLIDEADDFFTGDQTGFDYDDISLDLSKSDVVDLKNHFTEKANYFTSKATTAYDNLTLGGEIVARGVSGKITKKISSEIINEEIIPDKYF